MGLARSHCVTTPASLNNIRAMLYCCLPVVAVARVVSPVGFEPTPSSEGQNSQKVNSLESGALDRSATPTLVAIMQTATHPNHSPLVFSCVVSSFLAPTHLTSPHSLTYPTITSRCYL
uniref:Secreted protein n=1 Tax=Echinococcus granulosus TaxID=6210 RepID=A0A068X2P8_ECHGR|nr:hypothetical protein EgrG_002057900 [Echinococcus granulosus]